MSEPILRARGLRKAFGRTEALRGVSVEIEPGEIVAVTGPSGSGKSTLLLTLAGILRPESGEVLYDGASLADLGEDARTKLRRRQFGVLLQFGHLVPELTAVQNVALPLLLEKHDRASSRRSALGWLERLGVDGLADVLPGEMSGGEMQRVALARALVTGPRVLFADEPTGALDTVSGDEVLTVLLAEAKQAGSTVLVVTHDNRVAARADREIVLRDGAVDDAWGAA